MEQTITIISAIVGIIMLIVFFVMAHNINQIMHYTRMHNANFLQLAFDEGKAKKRTCPNCNKSFFYLGETLQCPHCFNINKINQEKVKCPNQKCNYNFIAEIDDYIKCPNCKTEFEYKDQGK